MSPQMNRGSRWEMDWDTDGRNGEDPRSSVWNETVERIS